jgi:hydroxymethylbilane synthase
MHNKLLRIGTRGSQLALYQAHRVKQALEAKFPDYTIEIKIIKTKGDKILDVALSKIGDKGLFTKELEVELVDKSIDIAVHSLKDLPTRFPEGCTLGGVLERGEFRDALVHVDGKKLQQLNDQDVVATSSLRRKAQLLKTHPWLKIVDIRGNVNSRLQKMKDGYCTAMIMAAAGLQRLELHHHISEILDPEQFIPAVSQGAIAMEIRENDPVVQEIIDKINHVPTLTAVAAERTFLGKLEGGCQVPIGCFTRVENDRFIIKGFVSNLDASVILQDQMEGEVLQSQIIADALAESFLKRGAAEILQKIRDDNKI